MTPTIAALRADSADTEREEIIKAMEVNDWRLTYAAMDLGVGNSTLQKMISTHGLAEEYRRKVIARRRARIEAREQRANEQRSRGKK